MRMRGRRYNREEAIMGASWVVTQDYSDKGDGMGLWFFDSAVGVWSWRVGD